MSIPENITGKLLKALLKVQYLMIMSGTAMILVSCAPCLLPVNSFIPVLHLALLPLISVFLCIRNPFVPGFSEEKLCKRGCVRLSYLCV